MIKIFLFIIGLVVSLTAVGDIYKFVDPDGHVYFSDELKNSSYKLIIKSSAVKYSNKLPKKRSQKELKEISILPPAQISHSSSYFSSNSKLELWPNASYKEQAKICESMAAVFNNPKITPLKLCLYLTEMANDGSADFMKISQVAALLITIAK